jgi:hypothetical protein
MTTVGQPVSVSSPFVHLCTESSVRRSEELVAEAGDSSGTQRKLKLIYDRQSVGQSVLVSGAHLEPATNVSFSLKFPSDSCVFVML